MTKLIRENKSLLNKNLRGFSTIPDSTEWVWEPKTLIFCSKQLPEISSKICFFWVGYKIDAPMCIYIRIHMYTVWLEKS